MNPNTVYRAMVKDMKSGNTERARKHAKALLEWISHPGARTPSGYSRAEVSNDCHWVLGRGHKDES
jgi:hypothetical protein